MADEPETPAKGTGGIGSKLTKKLGPLPVWAWGLGAAALAFLAYRYYQSQQSSAASATTATQPLTTATGASTPGSNGYQDNGQLSQLQQQLATLQQQLGTGTGAGSTLAPAVGSNPGGGFYPVGGAGGYETAGGTTYQEIANGAMFNQLLAAGVQMFTQPAPGIFVPYTGGPSGHLNTPVFFQTPYTGPAPTSGAGGSASPPGVGTGGTGGAPAPIQPNGAPSGGTALGPPPTPNANQKPTAPAVA
jgi:hypothetical protein